MISGIPPWHMWGSTQPMRLERGQGGPTTVVASVQLTKVNYARPDSWSFFFAARVLEQSQSNPSIIVISFNVTLGVGRSVITIPAFEQYRADLPIGGTPVAPPRWYSSTVSGPARDQTAAPPAQATNLIEIIPAQELNVECVATVGTTVPGNFVVVEVTAFVSPLSHQRPEWHRNPPMFAGGEA
jgi:hypothetical protein